MYLYSDFVIEICLFYNFLYQKSLTLFTYLLYLLQLKFAHFFLVSIGNTGKLTDWIIKNDCVFWCFILTGWCSNCVVFLAKQALNSHKIKVNFSTGGFIWKAFIHKAYYLAIPEKNKTRGVGLVRDMEFPGVLKKFHGKIPRFNWKRSGISRDVAEKFMWNFHGYWFLNLEFWKDVTQFCRISRGESLFSLKFPRLKWQI